MLLLHLLNGLNGNNPTFSTSEYENISLFQNQQTFIALSYITLSIVAGLLAVWLGLFLAK